MLVTNGELSYLRRLRNERSQAEEAEVQGISRYAYRQIEALDDKMYERRVSKYERLVLLRRRSGWTIAEVAEEYGCSPFWYRELEKQAHPDVEELLCALTPDYP